MNSQNESLDDLVHLKGKKSWKISSKRSSFSSLLTYKYLIERQKRALQHFADDNENLKAENAKLRAKNRRMKHMFVGFGNRFK